MWRNSELVKSQIKDLQSKNLDAVKASTQLVGKLLRHVKGQSRGAKGGNGVQTHKQSFSLCGRCNKRHKESECPANCK